MSKPRKAKKAPLAKRRRQTFRIVIEAQEMSVSYQPRWMAEMAKFEFRSPHRPPRRIPLSETGYLSHFVPMREVEAAKSPQDFAREEALALLRSRRRTWDATNELPLF